MKRRLSILARYVAWSLPASVLLTGLIVTAGFWWSVQRYVMQAEQQRFDRHAEQVSSAIVDRLDDMQRLLLAGRGVFDASASLGHHEWAAFSRSVDFNFYHGMTGVGFIERVPQARLADFVREVERDARLPIKVRQLNPTPRYPDLYVIRFVEPLAKNGPARGLDVGSEPNRRAAADEAMRSGTVSLTKRITLVQDQQKMAGFLMYAPVYRTRNIPGSEAERVRELLGWTYIPLRISELMEGVTEQVDGMIDFEVFEGGASERTHLLFDADGHFEKTADPVLGDSHFKQRTFHRARTLSLYGRTWTVYTSTTPAFDASANSGLPKAVAAGGSIISLLAALAAWSLTRTRARALRLADDMTQAVREHESQLRDSQDRLSAIIDSALDPIITIQTDGRLEHFNAAAERVFGYRADEVRGRNINILMPEPYHSAHDDYLANYRATGRRRIIGTVREVAGRRRDGEVFPMELSVSEAKVNGQIMYTGIVRDITERKKVDKMKSEFVSTVSHELRTPLTSIRGSLGLIVGGAMGEIPAQARSLVDIAYSNAERLVRLINDILDIEKIESGKLTFQASLQPLQPLLEQAVAANAGYGEQHRVTIDLVQPIPALQVNVDGDRFMQIMSNLLSNAIKYSPRGGVVSVRATERDGRVSIAVVDRGQGISAEFKQRIFSKFSQADSSDTRAKGGTGLGLSIVKSLVERMGGHVGYESTPGRGATFFFDLPVLAQAAEAAEPAPRPRMLVCDGNADVAHLIALMLKEGGVESDIALTAAAARDLLATQRYTGLTLDLAVSHGEGRALLAELRRDEATRALPVIVVSAQPEDEAERRKIASFQLLDWLQKPIDQKRLLGAIGAAMNQTAKDGLARVLYVEDDPDLRKVLQAVAREVAVFDLAENLDQAHRLLLAHSYDLVLLDITLPDGPGWDLLPVVSSLSPPPPVLVFSAQEVDEPHSRDIAGAMVKSQTSNEALLETIKSLIERQKAA